MRLIKPEQVTGERRCAITGRTRDPEGFIHTGRVLSGWDPEVSISVSAAKEMARIIGWASPEDVKAIRDRLAELEADYAVQVERLDKIERIKELEAEVAV